MSADQPIAEYEVASGAQRGARFTLYANRLVLAGPNVMETVPLAHLASVRIAFEREARKLSWAIALALVALALGALSAPLDGWMQALQAKVSAGGTGESIEAVLAACFSAIAHLARLLVPLAWLLAALAALLLVFHALGRSTLTLAFAATERACTVRGRDRRLQDFAELVAERLAERGG
ncbi:MAG TPA: hypothetical protein VMT02_08410 [Burkholderiales bacterium]|nr:hypothetical protein [Burkholderiales bacterium]